MLLYIHVPVQTAGDAGITEDPLGYFSAIGHGLQEHHIPGETHVPRAGLASCHPQSIVSRCSVRGCHPAVTLLDLHKDSHLADKLFPVWLAKEPD